MTPFPPKPKVVQGNEPPQPTLFPPKPKAVQEDDDPLAGMGFDRDGPLKDMGFGDGGTPKTGEMAWTSISTPTPTSVKTIAKLVEIEVDGVTIDVDPTNGGIVLDRGELTKMKAKGTDCNKVKEAVDNVMIHFNQRIHR